MAKTSTTQAVIRSGPKGEVADVGSTVAVVLCVPVAFDPTQVAIADDIIVLPKGVKVLGFQHDGGATGGASPTFIMGVTGDTNAYIVEGDADLAGYVAANGANTDVATTAVTELFVGVGTSAATGGTISGVLMYMRVDDDLSINT